MTLPRRLLGWLLTALLICAGILSPIAILVLLAAAFIPWWGTTLSNHQWLTVVLVLIFLSRWLVAAWMSYKDRKYLDYLRSPEGKRRRAEEVRATIAEVIADARRLGCHTERVIPVVSTTFSAAAVMTEAHRLAKNFAKKKPRDRGVKVNEVQASQIAEIARVLVEADPSIVETANVNLEKRSQGKT
jgi:hypothetical protein